MALFPLPVPTPLVNGNRYDYSALSIFIDGVMLLGQEIVSIDYKHGLKPEKVYGSSPSALGRTRGRYDPDGSMEINKEAYPRLVASLSADPSFGYMEKPFLIEVSYQDVNGPLITDTLIGCRIEEDSDSHKSGGENLTVRVTLNILKVLRDGAQPFVGPSTL